MCNQAPPSGDVVRWECQAEGEREQASADVSAARYIVSLFREGFHLAHLGVRGHLECRNDLPCRLFDVLGGISLDGVEDVNRFAVFWNHVDDPVVGDVVSEGQELEVAQRVGANGAPHRCIPHYLCCVGRFKNFDTVPERKWL
jgi:hypothetical protein